MCSSDLINLWRMKEQYMKQSNPEEQFTFQANLDVVMAPISEDLLYQILALLPISSLLRLRSVCKSWNSLVKEVQFQAAWAKIHGGELSAFYREFIEHVLKYLEINDKNFIFGHSVVVDGFLILKNSHHEFHVVDPANAYLKKIHHPGFKLSSDKKALGMLVYPGRKNYIFFMASKLYEHEQGEGYHEVQQRLDWTRPEDNGQICVRQYDSTQNYWRIACKIPFAPTERLLLMQGVAMHRDSLHFLLLSVTADDGEGGDRFWNGRVQVRHYDKRHHRWEDLTAGLPKTLSVDCSRPLLFDFNAKLFLTSFYEDMYCVWQYDDQAAEWNLFDKFPKQLIDIYSDMEDVNYHVQHHGSCLYLRKWKCFWSTHCTIDVTTYKLIDKQYEKMPVDQV